MNVITLRPLLTLLLALGTASFAAIDTYAFETAAEEARYKALIDELRCLKCLTPICRAPIPISADPSAP